ncbi:MAG: CBS domain-containing protein [Pseudomonadota bacterium]|nr:CBS domain-containing protein [Pseudomonadota bacterium]
MSANLVTLTPEMDVLRAIHLLVENNISGAAVVDDHGNLVGFLSERDCIRVALQASYFEEAGGGKVKEFMVRDVRTVDPETSVADVAELFLNEPYRVYPVVEDNRVVGHVRRRDVLRSLETLW